MNQLKGLIDDKIIRVVNAFIKNKDRPMYLREIAKISQVPPATTMRILNKISKEKIIEEIKISKFKFYKYHENKKIEGLLK